MQSVNLSSICNSLEKKDGVWFSKSTSKISYPEEGNLTCFQVEDSSFWFRHRNNCILSALINFPPNGLLFDIGGGNGFVSSMLQEHGYEVVLVEPGVTGALNAKKRGLNNVVCSTLEDANFSRGTMPAVGAFDVIEHIEADRSFVTQLKGYLHVGGRLYLTVPAFNILWSGEDRIAGHYRRYTLAGICKLLREVGFEINYSTYIFSILPLPIFLFRTLPSLLGIKRDQSLEKTKAEHHRKGSVFSGILEKIWRKELEMIKKRRKILIGSSCLVIAEKNA